MDPQRLDDGGPVLVSACLAGLATTHDGRSKPNEAVMELVRRGRAILVCPEQLGGLPTPRKPAEIVPGPQGPGDGASVISGSAAVVDSAGADVTAQYLRGAREALKAARLAGCSVAVLKARSPSCGSGRIHDGTFSGTLTDGVGVTTALLREAGIVVVSEEDLG